MREARFPILGANVVSASGPPPFASHVVTVVDGVPIGIVGGTSESLFQTTLRENLVGLRVEPLAPALLRAAEQGLAYARVYAADDPELEARLADINLGGKPEPRRRKLEVAAADSGNSEPLRLPPRRGQAMAWCRVRHWSSLPPSMRWASSGRCRGTPTAMPR